MLLYKSVDLDHAYLLLNHGPTIMVTSAYQNERSVMSIAWSMPVDFSPAKVALIIDKASYTRSLIEQSGEFAIHLPPKALADHALSAGSYSGKDMDKFAQLQLQTQAAKTIQVPVINNCLAVLECRVIPEPHNQQVHDLFIAHVTAAWADPAVFSKNRWHIKEEQRKSIHYQAGGTFFAIGEPFEAHDKLKPTNI